jgi:hypothetical protein
MTLQHGYETYAAYCLLLFSSSSFLIRERVEEEALRMHHQALDHGFQAESWHKFQRCAEA